MPTDDMGQTAAALNEWEPQGQHSARGRAVRARDKEAAATRRAAILTRTVEQDVIPRMLAARGVAQPTVEPAHVSQLAELTLGEDMHAASAFVLGLHRQGVAADILYLHLLTGAAQRLGAFWEDDVCDFTAVTVGLMRLHGAMRELGPHFLASAAPARGPRVLLVPLPGEQHTFGLSMVHDFFCRAGWNSWSGPVDTREDLASMVSGQHVDVLGFSLACDDRLDHARGEIAAARAASRNPRLAVMVGGPPFVADPALAAAIGADGTALDGLQAVGAAMALVGR